jgi:hypothetical protein
MLYQLPNGKAIYLSLEEYLDLEPEDIQYLISLNLGEQPNDFLFGSVIKKGIYKKEEPDFEEGIDYTPDSEDTDTSGPIDINNLPED